MVEEPTAPPQPVGWGTESDPFPVGTQFRIPNESAPGSDGMSTVTKVGKSGIEQYGPNTVFVDGTPMSPGMVQGRLNEEGWMVSGFTYELLDPTYRREITEARIRACLAYRYGKDNSSREFHKNVRKDSHETVGSVVYSLDGSPPKGYAIYVPELHKVSLYSGHGERFKVYSSTTLIDWEGDDEESDE